MQQRFSQKYSRLNYHLKKTEPLKGRVKRSVAEQIRPYQRAEKVSTIPRKTLIHNFHYADEPINQEHVTENISNAVSRVNVYQNNGRRNIFDRAGSEAKVKKIEVAQRGKSLKYWRVPKSKDEPKLMSHLKGFLNELLSSNDGCKCGLECPWTAKFMDWVQVPEDVYTRHYQKMLGKVRGMTTETEERSNSEEESEVCKRERQKVFNQIKKDITRTQSQCQVFRDAQVQAKGGNILLCYSVEDPAVGYVQGMNMVMAGVLYHVRDETKTYAVVRKLFHQIRSIYLNDFKECYRHVEHILQLLQQYILDLYEHLGRLGVELRVVVFPWVLSLLCVLVPLDYIHLVYVGFMREKWEFIYKVAVSVFVYHKEALKEIEESDEVLVFLSASNEERKHSQWEDIINYAQSLKIRVPK